MTETLDPWPRPLADDVRQAIIERALAANGWWQQSVIEALNLCPWAANARRDGRARVEVFTDPVPADPREGLDGALRDMAVTLIEAPRLEVTQIVFPGLALDALTFERWAKAFTGAAHAAAGRSATVAVAAFHPGLPWRPAPALALVPLLRRAPDPTVQWLRLDVLDRVREGRAQGDVWLPTDPVEAARVLAEAARPSVAARVAEANATRVAEFGHDTLEQMLHERAEAQRQAWAALAAAARARIV